MYLIDVVLPLPLFQTFYYLSNSLLIPGIRIIVPFKNTKLIGIVKSCEEIENFNSLPDFEYKYIEEIIDDEPILPYKLFPFLEWVSDYYLTPIGLVYKIALPSGVFTIPQKRIYLTQEGKKALKNGELPEIFSIVKKRGYSLKYFLKKTHIPLIRLKKYEKNGWIVLKTQFPKIKIPTEKFLKIKKDIEEPQNEILKYLKEKDGVPERILKKIFPKEEIKRLLEEGVLERIEVPKIRKILLPFEVPEKYELTTSQKKVLKDIEKLLKKRDFCPILLFGVTGSGKSLIYIELIKKILAEKKRVLVLVPEIALTTYMETFLIKYLGEKIALLHSGLSPQQKFSEWIKILKGDADIIIGTRSAIFAPVEKLGLIIVDEEHDPSYKEENLACKYNARDLALIRGKMEKIPVILGSATPSVKTYYLAKKGKYYLFTLKERPFTKIPQIKLIKNKKSALISEELKKEIKGALNKGKSVFLYLNRRGYAPLVRCQECQYLWECPNCGIPLTYHKEENALLCHYCDFQISSFTICPNCGGIKMKFYRAGTEKIEEEIKKLFPDVNVLRLDKDAIRTEKRLLEVLEKIYTTESKIIIGTQMGVHGHNFPEVNLVGVLKAEEGLFLPSYKAGERTFQLLIQASGRAGRKTEQGKVVFQTALPENYVIKHALAQDYESFYEEEIKMRKEHGFPPFKRLAIIRVEGIKEEKVREEILKIKDILKKLAENFKNLEILGPAPCPFRKLKGVYRWHIILKDTLYKNLNYILKRFLEVYKKSPLKLVIDIDPEEIL